MQRLGFFIGCGRRRRRRLDRQREPEASARHAAVRRSAVERADSTAVRLDDRATDRKPETDARRRRFLLAARELVKDARFHARRQAGAVIVDVDAHEWQAVIRNTFRADLDRRVRWRVLRGILEQIGEQPLHQHRVHLQQRQVGRQRDACRMAREHAPARSECSADGFLEQRPLALELQAARLQPRHVEQVRDDARHAQRFVVNGVDERVLARPEPLRRDRIAVPHPLARVCQHRREADDRRQRRAQIVRDGRQ